jgi:hypothetical protein
MQEYKPTTIQLRSFARKTLTYHDEKAYANPSCKPSFKRNAKNAKIILPSTSAPPLKNQIPNKGAKIRPQKSECCVVLVKMREKLLSI